MNIAEQTLEAMVEMEKMRKVLNDTLKSLRNYTSTITRAVEEYTYMFRETMKETRDRLDKIEEKLDIKNNKELKNE